MTKQERTARTAKIKASRAYGKTIGEKKAMGYEASMSEDNLFRFSVKVSYRKTESFRDFNEWRVDVYLNGEYFCHNLFETIEEAEEYAADMLYEF